MGWQTIWMDRPHPWWYSNFKHVKTILWNPAARMSTYFDSNSVADAWINEGNFTKTITIR